MGVVDEQAGETANLLRLANAIQQQVSDIQRHLTATSQSDPSFDGQAEPTDWTGIDDTRSEVIDNLCNLREVLLTPRELRSISPTDYVSHHMVDRFHLLKAVPVDGSTSYEELAKTTQLPIKTLRGILRHAMTQRIFCEPSAGIVAHTQASRLMAEDAKLRDWFGTVSQEVWPATTRICDATEKWPGSNESSHTGYHLAHGRSLYETLAREPLKHARYDNAMGASSNDLSSGIHHFIENFDWAGLGQATVVDLGGGMGTITLPLLNFVIEDTPEVLRKAQVDDPETNDRIRFLEHDIFQPQPIMGAAVYFIRRVLMEWTDEKAVEILRALKPALREAAAVLVQDAHVPLPGSCPIWLERKFRNADMLTLALSNIGPRDMEEWMTLFEQAGPGFEIQGVRQVPSTDIAFIKAVWRGDSSSTNASESAAM